MNQLTSNRIWSMFVVVVISAAVVGYFVGIQSPVRLEFADTQYSIVPVSKAHASNEQVIQATSYSEMKQAEGNVPEQLSLLSNLKQIPYDPFEALTISKDDKLIALNQRDKNRAFNGAPPTVPHPIQQMTDQTCIACHVNGIRTESLRASKMSHHFMANCTQCHVESKSSNMESFVFRENSFTGTDAPEQGPRAFNHAPPQIPHATWLRNDCVSCHGPTGKHGMKTTHPWRTSCTQCHTPTSTSEQILIDSEPQFVSPIKINNNTPTN